MSLFSSRTESLETDTWRKCPNPVFLLEILQWVLFCVKVIKRHVRKTNHSITPEHTNLQPLWLTVSLSTVDQYYSFCQQPHFWDFQGSKLLLLKTSFSVFWEAEVLWTFCNESWGQWAPWDQNFGFSLCVDSALQLVPQPPLKQNQNGATDICRL